ncbi:MAG TPA: alpha/beta hydrolase, partial [Flavisolibacter sp.]|nr:alpha/beta hydrolase [Flavisolibacter sp.]
RMDIYLPANRSADSTRVLVIIHGGAYTSGDKTEFNAYIPSIKQKLPGYAIFNINYKLAAGNVNAFPTQENDVKAALDFVVSKAAEYTVNGDKLVLLGASSGAHLALLQAFKYPVPKVKAVVDFFGPTDFVTLYNAAPRFTQIGLQLLLSGTPVANPDVYSRSSPINFVGSDSPPTIIFHGQKDDIVPISQSTSLKIKLDASGVPNQIFIYPNESHGWFGATLDDSFNKIAAFLLTHVA